MHKGSKARRTKIKIIIEIGGCDMFVVGIILGLLMLLAFAFAVAAKQSNHPFMLIGSLVVGIFLFLLAIGIPIVNGDLEWALGGLSIPLVLGSAILYGYYQYKKSIRAPQNSSTRPQASKKQCIYCGGPIKREIDENNYTKIIILCLCTGLIGVCLIPLFQKEVCQHCGRKQKQ